MHPNNVTWLSTLKGRFPDAFFESDVLEVGSNEPGGVTRRFFNNCNYLGMDLIDGIGVDVVDDFNTYEFNKKFDTIVMLSVFEHDPKWRENLSKAISLLNQDGYLIIGFGPEGNPWHEPEPWAPVPHKEFLTELCSHDDIVVVEAFFEEQMYGLGTECFNVFVRKSVPLPDAWTPPSPGRYSWQSWLASNAESFDK